MRTIHVVDDGAERADDVLLRAALLVAAAFALTVAVLAFNNPYALATLAAGAALAFAAWAYRTNELRRDLRVPLESVWDVSVESLGENGFLFGEPKWYGATEGRVRAGDALVVAERHPGSFTRVRVRVGFFRSPDNLRRASLILESVATRLRDKEAPAAQ